MNDKIEIGAVAKPQGIKGALKIKLFCDSFATVKNVSFVQIGEKDYRVESFTPAEAETAILTLEGVIDRNTAETFRLKTVFAEKGEVTKSEGKFFIADVIGCELVLSSGKSIGRITDVVKGNVDYYYLDTAEGKAVFPLIEKLGAKFAIEERKITVNAEAFTEVVLYED